MVKALNYNLTLEMQEQIILVTDIISNHLEDKIAADKIINDVTNAIEKSVQADGVISNPNKKNRKRMTKRALKLTGNRYEDIAASLSLETTMLFSHLKGKITLDNVCMALQPFLQLLLSNSKPGELTIFTAHVIMVFLICYPFIKKE